MKVSLPYRLSALAGAALLLAGGGVAWRGQATHARAQTQAAPSIPEIEAMVVKAQPVADQRAFSGRIEAVEQVEVRPLVSGTIVAVHFRDGDLVRKTLVRHQSSLTIGAGPQLVKATH